MAWIRCIIAYAEFGHHPRKKFTDLVSFLETFSLNEKEIFFKINYEVSIWLFVLFMIVL